MSKFTNTYSVSAPFTKANQEFNLRQTTKDTLHPLQVAFEMGDAPPFTVPAHDVLMLAVACVSHAKLFNAEQVAILTEAIRVRVNELPTDAVDKDILSVITASFVKSPVDWDCDDDEEEDCDDEDDCDEDADEEEDVDEEEYCEEDGVYVSKGEYARMIQATELMRAMSEVTRRVQAFCAGVDDDSDDEPTPVGRKPVTRKFKRKA